MTEENTIYEGKRKPVENIRIVFNIWRTARLRRMSVCFEVFQRENPRRTKGEMQKGKPELHNINSFLPI